MTKALGSITIFTFTACLTVGCDKGSDMPADPQTAGDVFQDDQDDHESPVELEDEPNDPDAQEEDEDAEEDEQAEEEEQDEQGEEAEEDEDDAEEEEQDEQAEEDQQADEEEAEILYLSGEVKPGSKLCLNLGGPVPNGTMVHAYGSVTEGKVRWHMAKRAKDSGPWNKIDSSETAMTESDYSYDAPMSIGAGSGYMQICAHVPATAKKKAYVELEGEKLGP